jgi:hypothetical protein
MSDEQIKQRIAYLVEHGGLWDDPHDDIRRGVTINRILAVVALLMVAIDLVFELIRL